MAVEGEAGPPPARLPRRRRLRLDLTTPTLLGLPVAWLVVFFLVPIAIVAAYSFDVYSLFPGKHGFTLAAWREFLHSSIYLRLFWKSVKMSLTVSAIIVVLAYPLAYYLALSGTKRKYVLLVLGYIWLPFVALPIFVSLESLDRRLLEAASDLGASRLQAFRRVTLPLSMPGVIAAFLFVFIPTLGEFVTPSLVGGASGYMYGNQIVDLFQTGFPDWQTGSVLAIFLLGVVGLLSVVFARFLRPRGVAT